MVKMVYGSNSFAFADEILAQDSYLYMAGLDVDVSLQMSH